MTCDRRWISRSGSVRLLQTSSRNESIRRLALERGRQRLNRVAMDLHFSVVHQFGEHAIEEEVVQLRRLLLLELGEDGRALLGNVTGVAGSLADDLSDDIAA